MVLSIPFSSKHCSGLVCLVAPIASPKTPHLISARHRDSASPRKGQVLELDFRNEGKQGLDYRVVDFNPHQTDQIREFYNRKHTELVAKEDWSVPQLQQFYSLDRLVKLTSQDQETLYHLLSQQPHILLFQNFKSLPCLTYELYEAACQHHCIEPEPRDLVVKAQARLDVLCWLYMQNVSITPSNQQLSPPTAELLERTGLRTDEYGEYSWPYTQRVESKLNELLRGLFTRQSFVNSYPRTPDAECVSQLVVLMSASPNDVDYRSTAGIEPILQAAQENCTYVDLSRAYLSQDIQELCDCCVYLFLHNVHLISPGALLGLLQNLPPTAISLALHYDCNYRSQTSRLLNRFAGNLPTFRARLTMSANTQHADSIIATPHWPDCVNRTLLRDGYSFNFPVTWMSESCLRRFIDLFKRVRDTAVLLTIGRIDYEILSDILMGGPTSGDSLRVKSDPFGGLVSYTHSHTEGVIGATPCATHTSDTRFYQLSDMQSASVQYLGQCKARPKYVFCYTTVPLDCRDLYKLATHAGENLLLSCAADLLPMPCMELN